MNECLWDIKKGGERRNVEVISEREGRKDWEVR